MESHYYRDIYLWQLRNCCGLFKLTCPTLTQIGHRATEPVKGSGGLVNVADFIFL